MYRIGGGPQAPASTLPIGAQRLVESGGVVKVGVGLELLHSVLGVSWGVDGKSVVERSVCGFVCVSAVDVTKKTVTRCWRLHLDHCLACASSCGSASNSSIDVKYKHIYIALSSVS